MFRSCRLSTLTLLVASLIGTNAALSYAATSIVFCDETGKYSYAWGPGPVRIEARESCLQRGGKAPRQLLYTETPGYGAVATSITADGQIAVGFSAAMPTRREAVYQALTEARKKGGASPIVRAVWHDP